MTVIKNQKSNTYEVRTYYKDWTGVRKQKTKRGFKRKCDAQEWERGEFESGYVFRRFRRPLSE